MARVLLAAGLLAVTCAGLLDAQDPNADVAGKQLEIAREKFGWEAFGKWEDLKGFLVIILVALGLGAFLGYHPFAGRKASLEDLDQPKIIILYTLVGALVAIVVAPIPAMAFAIFGIGGLMRFRTEMGATKETGRAILATLLGLAVGLEFWMVAVAGAGIAWILIAVLEYRIGMRMVVRGAQSATIAQTAEAYGKALHALGCRFATPRKNPGKGQVSFVLRARRGLEREAIEAECNDRVPSQLRGTIDWPEE